MNTCKLAVKFTPLLKECDVVIVHDLDTAGLDGATVSASRLYRLANTVSIARLPGEMKSSGGDDVRDVLSQRDGEGSVRTAIANAQRWHPPTGSRLELPLVMLPCSAVRLIDAARELAELLAVRKEYFVRGGQMIRLVDDQTRLEVVKPVELCSAFESVANLAKFDSSGEIHPSRCSKTAAEQIVHARDFQARMPHIVLLAPCPVLVERGITLKVVTGYDESGVFARGTPPEELSIAKATDLLNELLFDFDFVTPADKSRAIAALLTPALVHGGLLGGRAPIDLGEADKSQSGKGYRNKIIAAVYGTKVSTVSQRPKSGVGSMEEMIDRVLVDSNSMVAIDNVRGKIDSPALESLMTKDFYVARPASRHSPYLQPSHQRLQLERHPMNILGWPGKREIAFLCEVSEATVTNWIKAGKIPSPSMKVERGRWIWHPDLLYAWLELGRPAAEEFDRLLEEAVGEDEE